MKKYMYLTSDIFNEKNPTNGAIILTYDTNSKQLSVIDLSENKKEEKVIVNSQNNQNQIPEEILANLVSKAELEEVKTEFTGKIKDFLKIQGSCSLEGLSQKEKIKGHMWQVGNKEYVYNGSEWVEIGFEINLSEYAKKSELFSKSYNDLTDKPNIPTKISDLTNDSNFLTEHQSLENYATKAEVPTKISDLNNDAGFISNFTETDPLFASQSGQLATKAEIANLISSELDPKFAAVSGTFATKTEIPTKVSDLINDSNFLTEHQSLENYATKAEIANLISSELDPKFAAVSGTFANETSMENNINYLITKLSKVIKEVDALKRESNITINTYNPQVIKSDNDSIIVNDNTSDAIITSDEISGKATFTVKSIEIDNTVFDIPTSGTYTSGNAIFINSQEDASLTNSDVTTNFDQSSNVIKLTSAEVFKLDGVKFDGASYNTVMTGQNTNGKYLKYADITNCTFNDTCKHVYIWFAGWQDNAILNIKNCTFKSCEQMLCLSDYHAENKALSGTAFNNKLTVNIENCEIETYENDEGDAYSGIILCDSRSINGALANQFTTLNPFGNGKVTINIKNVTVGGVKLTKDNFLMGTKNIGQMLYVYHASKNLNYEFNETNKSLFPTIYVDGELITQLA